MGKNNKKVSRNNWEDIISGLSHSGNATSVTMGSPGSAQVTRCRLLAIYDGIDIMTDGSRISIWLT